jgi:histidinol-phosphatase (PHP family)
VPTLLVFIAPQRYFTESFDGFRQQPEATLIDLHTHHYRCGHAQGYLEDYIRKVVDLKLKIIGLSDHAPLFAAELDEAAPGAHMRKSAFSDYIAEANHLKEKYADQVEVLVGVEADFIPGTEAVYARALAAHRLDYILGSVHYFDGYHVYDPARWRPNPDVNEVYRQYFKRVQGAAASGLFDVLAYIDAVKGLGHKPTEDLGDIVDETVQVIKDCDMAVEINTSGIRKVEEAFPSPHFTQKLHQAGVPLTYGSDAHSVNEVGHGWEHVRMMLEDLGVKELVVFHNRRASMVSIDMDKSTKPISGGR